MAAIEVIHFPLCAQLERAATFLVRAFRGSPASPAGSPPLLFDQLQPHPDGIYLSFPAGGLCV